jgi:hypothetical protein
MKFVPSLFLAAFLATSLYAQAPEPLVATAKTPSPRTSEGASGDDKPVTTGKFAIPIEKTRPNRVPKIESVIAVDGRPDEESWRSAAVFKDFYQTSPGDNIAPSKPTEVLMMYDEKHLYIAFKCWDERDKIRASVAKRDNVFGEDNVRLWFDTYDDQRRAYVLGFNPLGIQQDGIYTEGQGADFSVDIVMESKGVIEDWGWSVEVKIPFKSLRYAAGPGKHWGFNAARNIDRLNDEFNAWMPDDRSINGFLIKFGKITGLDEIKYERTLELTPSITLSQTSRRVPALEIAAGRWVNQPIKQDIGLTMKYTISPNVTLDAAINPDFAEIEADAPVVTANQRFPIFFQEKRPFFLEGADVFRTPLSIFDSRSIIDPDFATKLTGKIGKNSFGFMLASDKAPGNFEENDRNDANVRPRIDEFLDKNALFGVLRVKRDFGKENSVGFFATYRGFPEQKNFLASVDSRIKLNPTTTAQFQLAGTTSRRCFFENDFVPMSDPLQAARNRAICGTGNLSTNPLNNGTYNNFRTGNGVGYYANVDHFTDQQGWFVEVGGRSKDFRADVGFTRRTDTNFAFFYHRNSTKSDPKAAIVRANWGKFGGVDYDWSGRLQKFRAGSNLSLSLQRSMFAFVEAGASYEKIYEEEFGLKRMHGRPGRFFGDGVRGTWQQFIYGEINQKLNKQLTYFLSSSFSNNTFDYFFPAPNGTIDPGPGKQFNANAQIQWNPIEALTTSVSYQKSRLVRNDNRVRSFDSDLVSLRSTYSFTRFIFTRMRLDYDSTRRSYAGQVLLAFTPSPGTAFYAGYNDTFNYNGFNPYTGQLEPGFQRNSRTFFIRASYLFRKSF